MLLILKLLLVPSMVAGVTLGARRWGPRAGGWLTALPVVAGPILCFYAADQGTAFAARAGVATLAGMVSIGAFAVGYANTCRRLRWPFCLLIGWTLFGVVTAVL